MTGKKKCIVVLAFFLSIIALVPTVFAQKPIIIGAPLATAFLYGWDAERGIKLAVDEINAAGGVKVGNEKRPFQVEVIDTRDLEPGVPVSEALLAVEKLILEKKVNFLIGGPVRSEAALAAMPLLAKNKMISILTTGSLTPKYSETVAKNPEKYKYCFRISGEAKWMVTGEIVPCLEYIGKTFGLNRLMIMVQDVAHARAGGQILAKIMAGKGWNVL
ncbi:MAG: ABC transporter substrate-binding protein, partial [Desulfomonilaceae bacterium]